MSAGQSTRKMVNLDIDVQSPQSCSNPQILRSPESFSAVTNGQFRVEFCVPTAIFTQLFHANKLSDAGMLHWCAFFSLFPRDHLCSIVAEFRLHREKGAHLEKCAGPTLFRCMFSAQVQEQQCQPVYLVSSKTLACECTSPLNDARFGEYNITLKKREMVEILMRVTLLHVYNRKYQHDKNRMPHRSQTTSFATQSHHSSARYLLIGVIKSSKYRELTHIAPHHTNMATSSGFISPVFIPSSSICQLSEDIVLGDVEKFC